jgi:pantoate--beta-alanine ligase
VTVVSIFVNPTQFNDPADLRNYPRDVEKDLAMLDKAGADIVFLPSVEEIYPEPDTRVFDFGQLDKVMEGATRPGHFNGVAQVVSRLFDIVKPQKAFFGQKDFQQVAIIRALLEQTGQPVEIVECPIVREKDGLAMSSRNQLLEPAVRAAAPGIYAALQWGTQNRAETPAQTAKNIVGRINNDPLLHVIYMEIVDPRTLQPAGRWDGPARGCVAVQAGAVRLIDNIEFA